MDAILKLHDKIENMKLGPNRVREIEQLEKARLRRLPLRTPVPRTPDARPPADTGQAGSAVEGADGGHPAGSELEEAAHEVAR